MTVISSWIIAARGIIGTRRCHALINIIFTIRSLVPLSACAGVIVDQVMAGTVIQTRLVLTIVNVGLTLFTSVARLAGAQKVSNKVCAVRVASTGIGFAFVNFWRVKRRSEIK